MASTSSGCARSVTAWPIIDSMLHPSDRCHAGLRSVKQPSNEAVASNSLDSSKSRDSDDPSTAERLRDLIGTMPTTVFVAAGLQSVTKTLAHAGERGYCTL